MSWYSNLFGRRIKLTETQRSFIYRTFGSFNANKMALNDSSYLTNGYESNIDVYSAIKKIVDVSSSVPFIVEEKTKKGETIVLTDTSIHELLTLPNKEKGYTWEDILFQLGVYILATGNGYLLGTKPEGFSTIEELDVLPTSFVCPEAKGSWTMPQIRYLFKFNNQTIPYQKDDLAHIKFFNPAYQTLEESLIGLSPIQVAARAVQVGNDRWDADANLLQNRGAIGMITDRSNRPMTPPETGIAQEKLDEKLAGTEKFGKIVVTNKDLDFIQLAMSSTDLQLIEKGVITMRAICNIFGIDSSLLNDPDNKTYNNRKEAEKALYTNAVIPLNKKIYSQLNYWLIPNHFPNNTNITIRPDYSKIPALQAEFKEHAEIYAGLKRDGIISATTAAEKLNLPPSIEPNVTIDTLKSMPALVANQMINSMTESEIRSMMGLAEATEPTLFQLGLAPKVVQENDTSKENNT